MIDPNPQVNEDEIPEQIDQLIEARQAPIDIGSTSLTDSLSQYFSRPVLLGSYTDINSSGIVVLAPLTTYFANPEVNRHAKYFQYISGTMVIRVSISVSSQAIGRVLVSNRYGVLTPTPVNDRVMYAHMHTLDHFFLDAANPTGEFRLPYFGKFPNYNIADGGVDVSEYVHFGCIMPFVNATDGAGATVSARVLAYMEDAKLSIPVVKGSSGYYTSKKSEVTKMSETGLFSGPATIVANAAKSLVSLPGIGPYAKATQMAASSASKLASMMGLSRPNNISAQPYPHIEDYSSYAGPIRCKTLTLDPLQEVPIPASEVGDVKDNLDLFTIVSKPGLCLWTTNTLQGAIGTLVFTLPVTFSMAIGDTDPWGSIADPRAQTVMPPISFVSQLFTAVRGTLRYVVTIPANNLVRGKLRFFYNHQQLSQAQITAAYTDAIQNASSVVLDLSNNTELTIDVPYVFNSPFCTSTVPWEPYSNLGYLYCCVEEAIDQPAASITYSIFVSVQGTEDFRGYIPNTVLIQGWRQQAWDSTFATNPTVYDSIPTVTTASYAPTFTNPPGTTWFGTYTSAVDYAKKEQLQHRLFEAIPDSTAKEFHMGEDFLSLRPVLKRFYPYLFLPDPRTTSVMDRLFLPYYPLPPYLNAGASSSDSLPVFNTPISFLGYAFYGVRGSTRYMYLATKQTNTRPILYASRNTGYPISYDTCTDTRQFAYLLSKTTTGEAAADQSNGESAIFQVPFQSNGRFYAIPRGSSVFTSTTYGVNLAFFNNSLSQNDRVFVAAGEDFNFVRWNGIPPLCWSPPHP